MKPSFYKSNLFIFSFLTLIAYLLICSTLYIGFNIDDDHQFITMNNPNKLFGNYGTSLEHFLFLQKQWFDGARFFPLLTTIIFLKAKWLGTNYFLQHVIIFFSGVASAFFIYKIFRLKNVSHINSLIGALVFYTGNEYGEIFWRLICGEGPGVLFFIIGVYYTLKYFLQKSSLHFWLSVLFLTFAALTKESFILLMPVAYILPLIGLQRMEEVKKQLILHKRIYLFAIIIFILIIGIVILMILHAEKLFDYGSPLSLSETILNNTYFVFKWFIPFLPVVIFALYFAIKNKSYKTILQLALLSICWITIHIIIYHKVIISFSMGKYIMPGGLVLLILLVFSLEYIKKNTEFGYRLVLIFVLLLLIRNAKITYINANEFSAKVNSFNKLIDTSIARKEPKIAFYGGAEFYSSVESHFKLAGYAPVIYSTKVVRPDNMKSSKYQNDAFENAMFETIGLTYPTKTLAELGADSAVKTLLVAEPLEALAINEAAITPFFPYKHEVITMFNNPKFSDLAKPAFWKGKLNNDQITYIYYSK